MNQTTDKRSSEVATLKKLYLQTVFVHLGLNWACSNFRFRFFFSKLALSLMSHWREIRDMIIWLQNLFFSFFFFFLSFSFSLLALFPSN